ncbi:MAG: murein biosynthesis integral membrane protein MurJ [Chloroflexi bacterium]|nr:murein biosynthesis integral membrane protein MurJ [Chloroflexota bacterium]
MEVESRGLGTAALTVVAGFVASRFLGLVRNMVIGDAFGTSPELDAYFAAFRVPDLIFQLLAGATLGSAFIPTFARYLTKGDPQEAWRLASSVLNLILIFTLVVTLLALIVAPWLVPLTVPGFSTSLKELTVILTRIMLLSSIFFCVSGIITGILNARYHFFFPALAPVLYNLSIIGGAVFLSGPLGVRGLAVGVVVGSFLHLIIQVPGLSKVGMRYRLEARLSHPGVREVGRLMLPRVFGLAAMQTNFLVTTILASTLVSGSLAALSYAWALLMLPVGVFGMAVGTAVFPSLAEQAAAEHLDALKRTLVVTLRLVLFLTIPATVGLALMRNDLVALIFQRGLFAAESTKATSWALLFYSLGLSGYAAVEILSRGFYALHDTRTPVVFAIVGTGIHIVLGLILIRFLDQGGLALSMSVATALEATALWWVLGRRLGGLEERQVVRSVVKTCIASAVMGAILVIFLIALNFRPWVVVMGGVGLGGMAFLAAAHVLSSEETGTLLRRLRPLV